MFSGHLDLIQLLVEHGADPFLCTTHKSSFSMTYSRSGVNAFNMAAMHGRRDVIQALLRVVAAQQQGSSVCKGRSIERRPQNDTIAAPEVCKDVSCHVSHRTMTTFVILQPSHHIYEETFDVVATRQQPPQHQPIRKANMSSQTNSRCAQRLATKPRHDHVNVEQLSKVQVAVLQVCFQTLL